MEPKPTGVPGWRGGGAVSPDDIQLAVLIPGVSRYGHQPERDSPHTTWYLVDSLHGCCAGCPHLNGRLLPDRFDGSPSWRGS